MELCVRHTAVTSYKHESALSLKCDHIEKVLSSTYNTFTVFPRKVKTHTYVMKLTFYKILSR